MASRNEIIMRAKTIATQRKTDATQSNLIDNNMGLQALYPHAVRHVLKKALESGENVNDFVRTHAITITGGVGTLPEEIIKDGFDDAVFVGRKYVSVFESLADFQRNKIDTLLDYFTVNGSQIYFSEANTVSFSGTLNLSILSLPAYNANADADTGLSLAMTESVIESLASLLTGEMSLAKEMK